MKEEKEILGSFKTLKLKFPPPDNISYRYADNGQSTI